MVIIIAYDYYFSKLNDPHYYGDYIIDPYNIIDYCYYYIIIPLLLLSLFHINARKFKEKNYR